MYAMTDIYKKIVTLSFTTASLIHISWLVYLMINPPLPDIEMYKTSLSDVDFPIVMKICLYDIKNSSDRYEGVGYKDARGLFTGKSRFNESQFGWRGFNKDGKPMATVTGDVEWILDFSFLTII